MMRLDGVRIAVTRAANQSRELADPLEAAGAEVVLCPLIRIEPQPLDAEKLAVINRVAEFDWIVFTSVNGVELLMQHIPAEALRGRRIACVGPATARALERYNVAPNLMPAEYVGDGLASALTAAEDLAEKKVLIARAAEGGQALPARLRQQGADVFDLELYRSVIDADGANLLRRAVSAGKIDLLTFTSGSTVTYFVQTVGVTQNLLVAVIGPSTADVARSHGLRVDIEANPHTVGGLVTAIIDHYAALGGSPEAANAGK